MIRSWRRVALVAAVVLVGCAGDDPEDDARPAAATVVAQPAGAVMPVSPDGVEALVAGGATIIDVRTPEEYAGGHLADAQLMNVQDPGFDGDVAELDPTGTYVVYCRTGSRSAQAAARMVGLGVQHVYDLGGIQGWQAAGMPVTTD